MLLDPRYHIYVAVATGGRTHRLGITHNLSIDGNFFGAKGYSELFIVLAGLPLALADYALATTFGQGACRRGPLDLSDSHYDPHCVRHNLSRISRRLVASLRKIGYRGGVYGRMCTVSRSNLTTQVAEMLCAHGQIRESLVRDALDGRILFRWELVRAVRENGGMPDAPIEDILQVLWLKGQIDRLPAVEIGLDGIPRCSRCGGTGDIARVACASCGDERCLVCVECAAMGEARGCRALYAGVKSDQARARVAETRLVEDDHYAVSACHLVGPNFDFELTPAQEAAARVIVDALSSPAQTSPARRECLVWAACGSGKTEVSFAAIGRTLARGGRVLFAIPRRDVVVELGPRLRRAFPGVDIAVLHGDAVKRYPRASIIIATTHQVIRFYRSFDLVVLDEFDAFPYRGNRMLQYAVRRAVREDGFIVLMSATPDSATRLRARWGEITVAWIPARHHGKPLPEPELVIEEFWRAGTIEGRAAGIIEECVLRRGVQVFVFVPTIQLAEDVARSLDASLRSRLAGLGTHHAGEGCSGLLVGYSHSRDPARGEKIRLFKEGKLRALVSTTIMERGITVTFADVVVLFADYEAIFDEAALVQMAGRAGRSGAYPDARVWFVARRETGAMRGALRAIREMNARAMEAGYLDEAPCPR
ncbi:MAG TPA: DEAD/DEAH box helicase family protein [Firmicutes bacterium]|nr:DEAD/DEAH box helicase family protein [Bacillota bacterium]